MLKICFTISRRLIAKLGLHLSNSSMIINIGKSFSIQSLRSINLTHFSIPFLIVSIFEAFSACSSNNCADKSFVRSDAESIPVIFFIKLSMITGVAVLSKGPILSTVLLIRVVNLSDWPVNWLFIELKTVKSGSSEKSSFQASI